MSAGFAPRSRAYYMGACAAKSGLAYDGNPFTDDPAAKFDWADGWDDATNESEVRHERIDAANSLNEYIDAMIS